MEASKVATISVVQYRSVWATVGNGQVMKVDPSVQEALLAGPQTAAAEVNSK